MSAIFTEGFDKYGPANSISAAVLAALTAGEWNAGSGTFAIAAGLNGIAGQALALVGTLDKTLPDNYPRLIGGLRFAATLSGTSGILFADGATAQCTVTINPTTGTFSLRTGASGGTAIATSSASVSANATHYLEWDIEIDASGDYSIWLDNALILTGTGNTKGGTANAYANLEQVIGSAMTIDDHYLFDDSGSLNNAARNDNPMIVTQFPTSDAAVQMTFGAALIGQDYSVSASTNAAGANQLVARSFTAGVACTLDSVAIMPKASSGTAKFKAAVYDGATGTLLSTGPEVVGCTSGTALILSLTTPQSLSAASDYWVGYITDTSIVLAQVDVTLTGARASNTYGSGAPGTLPTMTLGQASWQIWGNLSGVAVNWYEVANNPPPGDVSFVFDSTVGHEDLYGFPALPFTPSSIGPVAVKGLWRLSQPGVRTVDLRLKSGTTDDPGNNPGQTPAGTYGWLSSYFDADPDTMTGWDLAGVNNATAGGKIAS
jgi:hypothetical protein